MNIEFKQSFIVMVDGRLCVYQHRGLESVKELSEEWEVLKKEGKIGKEEILYEIDALMAIINEAQVLRNNIIGLSLGGWLIYNGYKFEKVSENLYRVSSN